MENKEKIAIYCATRMLYHDMQVCTKSLLYNTSVDKIYYIIEDDKFPYPLPNIVKTINVSDQPYIGHYGPNYKTRCTFMTLMRPLITKFISERQTILSLDCDTIFKKNGDELFNISIDDYYYGMVHETNDSGKPAKPYYNAGVMLMNLEKIADTGIDDIYTNIINSSYYRNAEQDVLSIICHDHILDLPAKFNSNNYVEKVSESEIVIRHFAAESVWQSCDLYKQYQDMTWETVLEQNKLNKGVKQDE